jgi:hypothetical protein
MVSYGSLNRIKLSLQKSKSYFFFLICSSISSTVPLVEVPESTLLEAQVLTTKYMYSDIVQ